MLLLYSLLVYLFDVNKLSPAEVATDLAELQREGLHLLAVANKADLATEAQKMAFAEMPQEILFISALQKTAIEQLKTALYDKVLQQKLNTQSSIVSNARHYNALQNADKSLAAVLQGFSLGITGDFLAQDIRHALIYLGEITGEVDVDRDILGNIFGKFCIGK